MADRVIDRQPSEPVERPKSRTFPRPSVTSTASCRGSRSTNACSTRPRTRSGPSVTRENVIFIDIGRVAGLGGR